MLSEILAAKHEEIEKLKARGIPTGKDTELSPIRDFKKAISETVRINLIAEIKSASPSAGLIRKDTDPLVIGRMYEEGGAAAISLLTDKRFFGGDLNDLPRLKKVVSLPILRKDFIVDEIQVRESILYGADAILLIARILSIRDLKRLLEIAQGLGLSAVTEVHDKDDLEKAIQCGANIIGINNRNLETFKVDLGTTMELAPLVPEGHIMVSESGISSGEDILSLMKSGVHAVLVGTSIMRSNNIRGKVEELVRSGTKKDGQNQGLRYNRSARRPTGR
jgi:indole-3-glycerol phosphate synthase